MPIPAGWNDTEAATLSDGFDPIPAGAYVACVGEVLEQTSKKGVPYYQLVVDVFEGERKGYWSDDWGQKHKGLHAVNLFISSERAMAMTKAALNQVTADNPGFDAMAAFEGDNWAAFRGRLVGIVVADEAYVANDGEVKVGKKVRRVAPVADVRGGKVKAPKPRWTDDRIVDQAEFDRLLAEANGAESGGGGQAAQVAASSPQDAPAASDDSDIPF